MVSKAILKKFLGDCISTGMYIPTKGIECSKEDILEIEEVLSRYNDTKARIKIIKILNR